MSDLKVEGKVSKDMGSDYIEKLSTILTEIDEYWQLSLNKPKLIFAVNQRIHTLFKKLSSKMGEPDKNFQWKYHRYLKKISANVFRTKRVMDSDGTLQNLEQVNPKAYAKYKYHLEKREMNLNDFLESKNLTAKEERKRPRIS